MNEDIKKRSCALILATATAVTGICGTVPVSAEGTPPSSADAVQDTSSVPVSTDGLDFSSARLILGTSDENIVTDTDNVVSEYDGVYLLQYDSAEEAENAYSCYYGKADFISPDTGLQAADDSYVTGNDDAEADTDALTALDTALEEADQVPEGKTIAVLDTGINRND